MEKDVQKPVSLRCSLPAALEVMGERWAFLILRGAFNGLCHFEQFQSTLGIARNILANRLARLVAAGILERQNCPDDRRKIFYRLTPKGEAFLPTLVALRQWGDRWESCKGPNQMLVDRRDHRPIAQIHVTAHDGRPLKCGELEWLDKSEIANAPSEEGASLSRSRRPNSDCVAEPQP